VIQKEYASGITLRAKRISQLTTENFVVTSTGHCVNSRFRESTDSLGYIAKIDESTGTINSVIKG
jgi:hypothetical protein